MKVDIMDLTIFILCIALFVVSNVIFLPLEAYYTISLYKHRGSMIIAKRRPGLVLVGVILASLYFLANSTWSLVIIFSGRAPIYKQLLFPVFVPIALLAWYIYIARLWLLFYQIQFNVETCAMKWQSIIDPTNSIQKWYYLHKETLGTWKWTACILIMYELIALGIVAFLIWFAIYQPDGSHWTTTLYSFHWLFAVFSLYIPLLLILFILCKTPSHYDSIGLVKEVKCTAICFSAIVITTSIVDLLLLQFVKDVLVVTPETFDIVYLVVLCIWRIVFFLACMIQTKFPIKRFKPILNNYSTSGGFRIAHKATLAELKTINEDSLEQSLDRSDTMKHILQNDESFELFAKHCGSEHCLECILSVIEFIQFKEKLYKKIVDDGTVDIEDLDIENDYQLIIPSSCPQSVIVYDEELSDKEIARKIYLKYIKVGSPFEINISYAHRKKYSKLMENRASWLNESRYNSDEELFSFFDGCIKEMCKLLTAAFSRYKQSTQYIILKRHSLND